jgi:hypothetical protein
LPSSLLPCLSRAARRGPPIRLFFKLDPNSRPSPAAARSPSVRCPGPARRGSLGRPIKPQPRTLDPARPAAATSCFANPSLHRRLCRRTSTARRSITFHLRISAPEALRCGKEHRRPLFLFFPAFPHARLLAVATMPRVTAVRPSLAPISPARVPRRIPCSGCILPVQPAIKTEPGWPFSAKSGETVAARCRRQRRPPCRLNHAQPSDPDPMV